MSGDKNVYLCTYSSSSFKKKTLRMKTFLEEKILSYKNNILSFY